LTQELPSLVLPQREFLATRLVATTVTTTTIIVIITVTIITIAQIHITTEAPVATTTADSSKVTPEGAVQAAIAGVAYMLGR
jgi:hypothetical protein